MFKENLLLDMISKAHILDEGVILWIIDIFSTPSYTLKNQNVR